MRTGPFNHHSVLSPFPGRYPSLSRFLLPSLSPLCRASVFIPHHGRLSRILLDLEGGTPSPSCPHSVPHTDPGDLSNWEIRALSLPGLKPFEDPYDLLLKTPILGLHSRPLVRAASPYIHLLPKLNYLFPEHCAVPCLCTCCSHFMPLPPPSAPQCTWYSPYPSGDGSASPAVPSLCRPQ